MPILFMVVAAGDAGGAAGLSPPCCFPSPGKFSLQKIPTDRSVGFFQYSTLPVNVN